jgi:hypothetical protein
MASARTTTRTIENKAALVNPDSRRSKCQNRRINKLSDGAHAGGLSDRMAHRGEN